jgi:hypothetical protein
MKNKQAIKLPEGSLGHKFIDLFDTISVLAGREYDHDKETIVQIQADLDTVAELMDALHEPLLGLALALEIPYMELPETIQ